MKKYVKHQLIHCNVCLGETKHIYIASRTLIGKEELLKKTEFCDLNKRTIYTMFECMGCGSCTLEEYYEFYDEHIFGKRYYPHRTFRKKPFWLFELDNDPNLIVIRELFHEIYEALYIHPGRLAIMGLRAVLDLYLTRKVGDIGGFEAKLNKIEKDGYITKNHRDLITTALDAGNAVTHRGHYLKPDEIDLVMDVVENMMQTIILEKKIVTFKKNIPKRTRKT